MARTDAFSAGPPLKLRTGADALIEAACQMGVEVCFANPGTTEMWVVSALDKQLTPPMTAILGLHETVVTGACDGYARMARKPALALLHLGPGLCNGLANLHNARRARSPVLVLVGDMASWHAGADAVLAMDIAAAAATVSRAVLQVTQPAANMRAAMSLLTNGAAAGGETAGGVSSANEDAGGPSGSSSICGPDGSRVVTLIMPHDLSWEAAPQEDEVRPHASRPSSSNSSSDAGARRFMKDCAAALRSCPPGKAAIYIGGRAMLENGGALMNAGKVAASTRATLLCEPAFARLDRGAGRPDPFRLPYFPQEAERELAKYSLLVVVDAPLPVANFGYQDGPSQLVHLSEDAVWHIDGGWDTAAALQMLSDELGATQGVKPLVNCRGAFCSPGRPPMPRGKLTAPALCAVVAALQPESAIVVDESLTSGGAYWQASRGCPPFSHLTLTGGAIGCGPPLSVGAAVACGPSRPVINFQADGSAMYSLQALWTQARERLHVVTIICANSAYAILKVECARQRVPTSGAATRSLTDLSRPRIDWVSLAQGMGVPATRAETVEDLAEQLSAALAQRGPHLIEAMLI